MEITGAQILVQTLIEQGADVVFGYPGGYVIHIFDALGERPDDIRLIMPAHEQGGTHAAEGYARLSGKTGVMIATSGPGATNLITGIANAYMDSVPLVCITGNVPAKPINMMGRDSFQEIDICGVTIPITKHNFLVQNVETLAETIREAFVIANSGRPGPVLIDIPKDITADACSHQPAGRFTPRPAPSLSEEKIKLAANMLELSERPLLFCGGGVINANASGLLAPFIEKASLPAVTSLMGLTSLPANHPSMLGMIGMHGTPAANYAGEHCDLLISVGTRFSDRVAGNRTRFAPRARLIHIDIDPSEFDKNVICDLHIESDARDALERLTELVSAKNNYPWLSEIKRFSHDMPEPAEPCRTHPRGILRAVREQAGERAVIVTDVGQHQMWTAQYYPFCTPRSLITSGGLGAMGFGLGAAIGAKAASPGRPVVLITGDGSFHMNLCELATAVTENLPVIVVLMNNGVLGMVRQWQSLFCGDHPNSTDTRRQTDYVSLAHAFGGIGFHAGTMDEFASALHTALASGKTCVIDCVIDPEEMVFPIIPPGKSGRDIIYGGAVP